MNLSTVIVLLIVVAVASLAVYTIINDKKKGKSTCGGNCGNCGSNSMCHDPKAFFKNIQEQEFKH